MVDGFGFAGNVLSAQLVAMPAMPKCMYGVKTITIYNNSIFVA